MSPNCSSLSPSTTRRVLLVALKLGLLLLVLFIAARSPAPGRAAATQQFHLVFDVSGKLYIKNTSSNQSTNVTITFANHLNPADTVQQQRSIQPGESIELKNIPGLNPSTTYAVAIQSNPAAIESVVYLNRPPVMNPAPPPNSYQEFQAAAEPTKNAATTLVLGPLVDQGGVVLTNPNGTPATTTITYYNAFGGVIGTKTFELNPGAFHTDLLTVPLNPGVFAWAEVVANQPLAGSLHQRSTATGVYNLEQAQTPATLVFVPRIFKYGQPNSQRTKLQVINPNGGPANVTVTFYNSAGAIANTLPTVIGPKNAFILNLG